MIQVHNLTKKYGDRIAVDDLTFTANQGEVLGFLGPNGAGKTTTMKIITGCLSPTSGYVTFDGQNIIDSPIPIKSRIGYLPEIPPLYEGMYVKNYLLYIGKIKRCPSARLSSLVDSAMERSGITDVRHRLIGHLSKGYKQRVGLAQALVADPDVLILDEPTAGLDPVQVMEIRELISQLKSTHTIILSTHILSEVEANCEKVVIINQGKLATQGDLLELQQKMATKSLRVRIKNPQSKIASGLQSLPGVADVKSIDQGYKIFIKSSVHEEVASFLIKNQAGLIEMIEDKATLENIFIDITK